MKEIDSWKGFFNLL